MKVLIIEDEPRLLELYQKIIEDIGIDVSATEDPLEAIELCERETFSLAIVDLMLPEISGIETIERIRNTKNHKNTNIIVMTNMGSGFDNQRLEKLGVRETLLKLSVGPNELRELVTKYA